MISSDAHELASGRLTISLTDTKMRNRRVTQFDSRQDLVDAVVCTCFIPAFSGYETPRFRGEAFLDGGLSDNQPVLDDKTVRITPFAAESHIGPRDPGAVLHEYANLGKLGSERLEVSARNARRLMKAFSPASDFETLYDQGYENT